MNKVGMATQQLTEPYPRVQNWRDSFGSHDHHTGGFRVPSLLSLWSSPINDDEISADTSTKSPFTLGVTLDIAQPSLFGTIAIF